MTAYSRQVTADIERWRVGGLIDDATARALAADVAANMRKGLSIGSILAMLAAALFAAAILLVIAANWEAIDRQVRVGMVFLVILAGYVGGAILKMRDHGAFAEAAWFIAAVAFGGAIALIGQMYHLSGDEKDAILAWCAGTGLAAALLRSGTLTSGAVLLLGAWFFAVGSDMGRADGFPHIVLFYGAVLWAISIWTQAISARQLLLLGLILYAAAWFFHIDERWVLAALALVSALVFLAASLRPDEAGRLVGLGQSLPTLSLLGFLTGAGMLQIDLSGETAFILMAVIIFGGIVAALVLAGQENRTLRWLAYAAFGIELSYIYVDLIGSMLGTAGFFLAAATILGLLAFFILRIERRFNQSPAGGTV